MRCGRVLLILVGIALTSLSCRPVENDALISFDGLLIDSIRTQGVSSREYIDVAFEKMLVFPSAPDVILFDPGVLTVDVSGDIYVVDFGVNRVLKFSPDGQYMAMYGAGLGVGPGELTSVIDFGIQGDSIVYVMDTYGRRLSYFEKDGSFLASRSMPHQPMRFAVTDGGRQYTMYAFGDELFESRLDTTVMNFGKLVPPGRSSLAAGGVICTFRENLIFTMERYPLIVQYEPDGSIVYARTTPDEVEFEGVTLEERTVGNMSGMAIASPVLNITSTVEDEHLFVHANVTGGAIDVYEASTGDYKYSMRLPTNNFSHFQGGKLYQTQDSTVTVWAIDGLPGELQ